jgi:3-dehydroquinate dehydratase
MSRMLKVEGFPTRNAIIHYIHIENIHQNASQQVTELFNLIEKEESPFTISKVGKNALKTLCDDFPNLEKYKPFIAKSLSVRILQKCKNFYKNMKLSKLLKLLQFYKSESEIEKLLYECNREGLLYTTLNYHTKQGEAFLVFNPEAQVAENLAKFGDQLKEVFQKVHEVHAKGHSQRERFFGKAKDKIEDEIKEMQDEKQKMQQMKTALEEEDERRKKNAEAQRIADEERKKRELVEKKLIDDQNQRRAKLIQDLEE